MRPPSNCAGTTGKDDIRKVLRRSQPEQLEQSAAQVCGLVKREPLNDDTMRPSPGPTHTIAQDRGELSSNSEESTVEVIMSNKNRQRKRKRVQNPLKHRLPPPVLHEVSVTPFESLDIVPIYPSDMQISCFESTEQRAGSRQRGSSISTFPSRLFIPSSAKVASKGYRPERRVRVGHRC